MRPNQKGLTLLELLMTITIIGILAVIAIPGVKNMKSRSRAGVMATHVKTFEKALFFYCQSTGHYPPEALPGRDPGFLTNVEGDPNWRGPYLKRDLFDPAETPIGGRWNWDNNELNPSMSRRYYTYGIAFNYSGTDRKPLDHQAVKYLDGMIDDGNVATGRLRTYRGQSLYVYEFRGQDECQTSLSRPGRTRR